MKTISYIHTPPMSSGYEGVYFISLFAPVGAKVLSFELQELETGGQVVCNVFLDTEQMLTQEQRFFICPAGLRLPDYIGDFVTATSTPCGASYFIFINPMW